MSIKKEGSIVMVRKKATITPMDVKMPTIFGGRMVAVIKEKKPIPVVTLVKKQGSQTALRAVSTASP